MAFVEIPGRIVGVRFPIVFESYDHNGASLPMRSAFFVFLLLTCLALSGCMSSPERFFRPKQTILAAERVELPTVFINGMPYVELKINGKGPYRFLVDTGAAFIAISPRVAREAHVRGTPTKVNIEGSTGASEDLSIVTIDQVEAPGFILKGIQGISLSLELIQRFESLWGSPFDGIIGMATLQQVLLEIDYPQQKVSVAKLDSATPSLESGHPYSGTGEYAAVRPYVKFATSSVKQPLITVQIDTGEYGGFYLSDITAFPVLVGLSRSDEFHYGIGGSWRPFVGQLNGDILLGQATWRNPKIQSANENRIGSEALQYWKLVIDPKRKLLWLVGDEAVSTTTYSGPLDPDGCPSVYGFAADKEGDSLIVKEVDPGSRAERAGVKVGDRYTEEAIESNKPGAGTGGNSTRNRLHIVRGEEKLEIVLSHLDPLPAKATSGAEASIAPADVMRN